MSAVTRKYIIQAIDLKIIGQDILEITFRPNKREGTFGRSK